VDYSSLSFFLFSTILAPMESEVLQPAGASAMPTPPAGNAPRRIPALARLAVYLGLWVLAMAAFVIFIDIGDGAGGADLTSILLAPVYTPFRAVFGLAVVLDWFHSDGPLWLGILLMAASTIAYSATGIAIFRTKRTTAFVVCCILQAVLFAISIAGILHLASFDSGCG
jgi:hypothetical protein